MSYSNTSDTPNTAARTVSYVVNDGALNSSAVTSTINVTAVNDAPVVAVAIPDQVAVQGTAFSYTFPADTFTRSQTRKAAA